MKLKKYTKILLILLLSVFLVSIVANESFSVGSSDAIDAMDKMANTDLNDDTGKLGGIINAVIGLIQVAGTGISMIMVTVLGIRYLMAAPNDKADVKKQIAPLVIGAVILFAAVNLVDIIANMATDTLSKAAG